MLGRRLGREDKGRAGVRLRWERGRTEGTTGTDKEREAGRAGPGEGGGAGV